MMKWIDVNKRLPKIAGTYAVEKLTGIATSYFNGHSFEGRGYFQVTVWLDESDCSDEEAAFNAAREISDEILSNSYDSRKTYQKYETFQDYLKSKYP